MLNTRNCGAPTAWIALALVSLSVAAACAAPQHARSAAPAQPPLVVAAMRGDLAQVKKLVAEGANANTTGKNGYTPLMAAAMYGRTDVARFLLDHRANPNARMVSYRKGWLGFTPLAFAATNGKTAVADLLLTKHATADARVTNNKTPLMLASMWGYTDTVKSLLRHGANARLKDATGYTALTYAKKGESPTGPRRPHGHTEIMKLLVHAGAGKAR